MTITGKTPIYMLNRRSYLAAYKQCMVEAGYPWTRDAGKLATMMEGVRVTITPSSPQRRPMDLLGGPSGQKAWRMIGGKGKVTYKALLALPD